MATLYWPFSRSLVSEWPGTRPAGWADHVGTDFAIPQGTPLRATMSGTVDIIWNDGLGAWVIDIIAPDGTVARHGHLSHMAPRDGDWVNAGDYIGNTGGALGTPGAGLSTGAHLHWEIRNNQGWGNYGWYDPRHLTINHFDAAPAANKPAAETRIKKGRKMFMVFYEHGNGRGKPGWLVVGTPRRLIISTQKAADAIAEQLGVGSSYKTDAGGWKKFLRAAGDA